MLGRRYPRRPGGSIDWRAARVAARDVIARAGSMLDVRRNIAELGIADRTRVAIARALPENDEPSIIVLDEPTAALPARDVEQLFGTIRHLTAAGNTVILVSHHLDEILGISDSITVLRDGLRIATVGVNEVNHDSLVRLIIGKELVKGEGRTEALTHSNAPMLAISGLSGDSVLDVSTLLHPGEIVGVAGLAGSGRELLVGMVTGRLGRSGTISVAGVEVPMAHPKAALAAGMAWISGERARYGTFSNMDLRSNLTMGDLKRHTSGGRINIKSERAEVRDWIERLGIVTRGPDVPITSLSGGNQQKVLVARALRLAPRVLVLDDPTAGIDVGAASRCTRSSRRTRTNRCRCCWSRPTVTSLPDCATEFWSWCAVSWLESCTGAPTSLPRTSIMPRSRGPQHEHSHDAPRRAQHVIWGTYQDDHDIGGALHPHSPERTKRAPQRDVGPVQRALPLARLRHPLRNRHRRHVLHSHDVAPHLQRRRRHRDPRPRVSHPAGSGRLRPVGRGDDGRVARHLELVRRQPSRRPHRPGGPARDRRLRHCRAGLSRCRGEVPGQLVDRDAGHEPGADGVPAEDRQQPPDHRRVLTRLGPARYAATCSACPSW